MFASPVRISQGVLGKSSSEPRCRICDGSLPLRIAPAITRIVYIFTVLHRRPRTAQTAKPLELQKNAPIFVKTGYGYMKYYTEHNTQYAHAGATRLSIMQQQQAFNYSMTVLGFRVLSQPIPHQACPPPSSCRNVFSSAFPYVCPEPVWVKKISVFNYKMAAQKARAPYRP